MIRTGAPGAAVLEEFLDECGFVGRSARNGDNPPSARSCVRLFALAAGGTASSPMEQLERIDEIASTCCTGCRLPALTR